MNLDELVSNKFPDVMVVHIHMLSPGMKDRVSCQCDGTDVVTVKEWRVLQMNMELFEKGAEPNCFSK